MIKAAYLIEIHRYLQRHGSKAFLKGMKSKRAAEFEKYTRDITETVDTNRGLFAKRYFHAKPHKSFEHYHDKAYSMSRKAAKQMASAIQKGSWKKFLKGAKTYSQGGHMITDLQAHHVKVRNLYPRLSKMPVINRLAAPIAHWKHPA